MRIPTWTFLGILLLTESAMVGQGSFRNLGFEEANLPILPTGQYGGLVPISDALPGWRAFFGSSEQTQIYYNTPALSSPTIWVVGPNFSFWSPIEGRFTVLLGAGTPATMLPASISQSGLVPPGTRSIWAKVVSSQGNFEFSLGGIPIAMFPISSTTGYTLFAGDVSALAGQVAELRIAALALPSYPPNGFRLDSIQFSELPIPEPSSFVLLGVGVLFLGWRLRLGGRP